MWSAAADPCVLRARPGFTAEGAIDLSRFAHRTWRCGPWRYVRIDLPDAAMRIDIVDNAMPAAMVIELAIDLRRPLEPQLLSIRRLHAIDRGADLPLPDQRFVRLVEALRVADALAAGASLRDIGVGAFGTDWPGDGEHLKSRVRRRVALAAELSRAGPRGVLSCAI